MRELSEFISGEEEVNEGLHAIPAAILRGISPADLKEGIMNMYDYICDGKDIKLFYQDYPKKEQIFWRDMYKMYENKLWYIADIQKSSSLYSKETTDAERDTADVRNEKKFGRPSNDRAEKADDITDLIDSANTLVKIQPNMRREFRKVVQESRNNNAEIDVAVIQSAMIIDDQLWDTCYMITINKIVGFAQKIFKFVDIKFLESVFKKIGEQ